MTHAIKTALFLLSVSLAAGAGLSATLASEEPGFVTESAVYLPQNFSPAQMEKLQQRAAAKCRTRGFDGAKEIHKAIRQCIFNGHGCAAWQDSVTYQCVKTC